MKIIKLDSNCFLVEYKYKDFLRIGHEFQGGSIVKLEKADHFGSSHVKVHIVETNYKI